MMELTFVFCLVYLTAGKRGKTTVLMVGKDKDFTAALGESVTLECLIKSDIVAKYYWYKESVGYFPRLVSSLYTYDESKHFSNEFSNNPRFALDIKNGKIRLMISDLQLSDTATYYCAGSFSETLEFEDRITIIIKGSGLNIPVFIQRPEYYPSQSEGAVRLNCTTHGRIFDEEHGVYHLRTSGSPDPGFLYTWKNNTCFYSLPASSQAVDCAVATCAHILPRAPYEGETEDIYLVLVYILSGALAVTFILSGLMAVLLYKICRTQSSHSGGSPSRFSDDPQTKSCTNEDVLYYAALTTSMINRRKRKMDNINEECVYTEVTQHC